jgi:hypothetical protein
MEAAAERENEDHDQGAFRWERLERKGQKGTRPSRGIIDVGAFRKLIARGFDARPKDVKESDRG